ncbi:unnamed protein product [Timema podura]|uniref:Ionotropic glutamate receptor L-glutamate and glycine-binding domain-containing protein n=1 Tax=Timema podura TaxID=61482 RepID=A0ABN7PBU1_TIMPD|nr:unnamed protein product [Timema podura]
MDWELTKNNGVKIKGFAGSTWGLLEYSMNFTSRYVLHDDKDPGEFVNGSWTGLLGRLSEGQIHVAINMFLGTSERASVADLIHSIWRDM